MTKERDIIKRLIEAIEAPRYNYASVDSVNGRRECFPSGPTVRQRMEQGRMTKRTVRQRMEIATAMADARALLAEPEVTPLSRAEAEAMVDTLVDAVQMTEGYAGMDGARASWLRWLEVQHTHRAALLAALTQGREG